MNNSFYYLRRVSDNGLPAQASLCSPEKPWFTVAGVGKLILLVIMSWMCGQPRRIKALRQQD